MRKLVLIFALTILASCSTSSNDRSTSNPNIDGISKAVDHFVEGCLRTAKNQNDAPDVFTSLGYRTIKSEPNKLEMRSAVAKVLINRSSNSDGWGQCAVLPSNSNANVLLTSARPKIEAAIGPGNQIPGEEAWRVPGTASIVLWSRKSGGSLARTQNLASGN